FRDALEGGVVELEPPEHHLEGAEVALVRELAVEHVEAKLTLLVLVVPGRDELEARLFVDESADEPRAGHPVHVDAGPGDPGRTLRPWLHAISLRLRVRGGRRETLRQLPQETLGRLAAPRREEVERGDLGQAPLEARQLGFKERALVFGEG